MCRAADKVIGLTSDRGVRRPAGPSGPAGRSVLRSAALLCTILLAACGDDATGPPILETVPLELDVVNLARLDPATDGSYEAWVIDAEGGIRSAGRFTVSGRDSQRVALESPIRNPTDVMVTVQQPDDPAGQPSMLKVMGGRVSGGTATLDVNRYLTAGVPLEERPGTHVLFTPSDNLELGFPSNEDSGIWLFNIDPDVGVPDSLNPAFYLTFTPLTRGWAYEGWVVRDHGTADDVWFSYGQFEADAFRKARFRDETGLGPFSGQIDYREAMPREIQFPGDDWVANPLDIDVPGDVPLPLDLNGCLADPGICAAARQEHGPSRYTHVITIEPWEDRDTDPWARAPFFLRPYRNPIGEANYQTPREIGFFPADLPRGRARIGG